MQRTLGEETERLGREQERILREQKGLTINLINEISEVDGKIGTLYNQRAKDLEAYVQIPPKDNCIVM